MKLNNPPKIHPAAVHITLALLAAALLSALLVAACTDARLYGIGGEDPSEDRVGLTGTVCTDDPQEAGFPVRVLFLVDTAAGPLFSSWDVAQVRLQALRDTVALHEGNEAFSFAVVGAGASARVLAPTEGYFTRNPGVLDNGIAGLSSPEGCVSGVCRDYDAGLRMAQSLIEGDLAALSAGERGRTQYVIVWMMAGSPQPLRCASECCDPSSTDCPSLCTESWDCTQTTLLTQLQDLRARVEGQGALSFSLHTLFLAATEEENDAVEEALDNTEALLQALAFAGAGSFERFDTADSITLERLGLLKLEGVLQAKSLLVTNLSLLPSASGGETDSDGDGLGDGSEAALGTNPLSSDGDGDGIGDLVEALLARDPLQSTAPPPSCTSLGDPPWADVDGDRLNDCEERLLGTDPSLPDTDGDGITDWIELIIGTDYLRSDDLEDSDWDGANNGEEARTHTDPRSTDAAAHLTTAYRYEVTDLGRSSEPSVSSPTATGGVTVLEAGLDTTGGLGTLRYLPGTPPTLSWQDPQDTAPGPEQPLSAAAIYTLPSSSVTSAGLQRWVALQVDPALLPPNAVEETLLVRLSERHCLAYTVRNIGLTETGGTAESGGRNDLFIYFAEAPADRLTQPGLFRVAHIPVIYHPSSGRQPSAPLLEVLDGEFATIGQ